MNKKKISQLPIAAALTGAELVETVQGGINKKTTTQDIADLLESSPKVLMGGLEYTGLPSNVPVISVQKNSIGGTPVMSRVSAGSYRLTLTGLLPAGKTFVTFGNGLSGVSLRGSRISDSVIVVSTVDSLDYVLSGASVKIEVYP